MQRKTTNYLVITLSALSVIFAIYIGTTLGKKLQLDVTEERLYSLSEGSKAILTKLNGQVKLKLYYSKTAGNKGTEGIRGLNNYYEYIRDLLEEYASHSKNKLTLEVIDPRPDTKDEEDAMAYGLKRFNVTDVEKYFFGLVAINDAGTEKIIEFFDPNQQENVEYQITKLIYSVTNPQKKKVGILSSLPIMNDDISPFMQEMMRRQGKNPDESWVITKMIKELYDVTQIKNDVEVISGIDILVIVHPKNTSKKLQFAIDQFVINGGRVVLFVDPHSMSDQISQATGGFGAPGSTSSELNTLMKAWGIQMDESKFAGDKNLAGIGKANPLDPPSKLLPLLACDRRCGVGLNDNISSSINSATLVYPGALYQVGKNDYKISPILATTEKGNTYTAIGQELGMLEMLWNKFSPGESRQILAYKIVGKFKSAFSGPVEIEEDDKNFKPDPKKPERTAAKIKRKLTGKVEAEKESAIIVWADVDFLSNSFAFRETIFGTALANDNATLALNSIEAVSGSTDLMSVRAKGRFNRSFDVIDAIEEEAEKKTATKTKEINSSIEKFTIELNQLGRAASDNNIALIQSESIQKKKELSRKIADLRKDLREVKREGREQIENIGKIFQWINTILVPVFLLALGIFFNYKRKNKFHIKS